MGGFFHTELSGWHAQLVHLDVFPVLSQGPKHKSCAYKLRTRACNLWESRSIVDAAVPIRFYKRNYSK